jgi:hypothetical protein
MVCVYQETGRAGKNLSKKKTSSKDIKCRIMLTRNTEITESDQTESESTRTIKNYKVPKKKMGKRP